MGYTELNIEGVGILVTNLAVNYKGEGFYSDRLLINLGMGDLSKVSLELLYEVHNQDTNKQIATALTTLTFYDYRKSTIVQIPQPFLQALEHI